jgi:hypothetical protein
MMFACQWILLGMILMSFALNVMRDHKRAKSDDQFLGGFISSVLILCLLLAIQYGAGAMSEIIE